MRLMDTGLTARELKALTDKYMVETYPRYDFVAERAEGMYLYDEKGNAYLDFYGGVAVNTPATETRRSYRQSRSRQTISYIRLTIRIRCLRRCLPGRYATR